MSNAETPAENTGGATVTSTANTLADLPDRTRVHVVAKRLGTSSREVLATLAELGESARSPQSGVTKEVAFRVAVELGVLEPGRQEEHAHHTESGTATPAASSASGQDPQERAEEATPLTASAAAGTDAPEATTDAPEAITETGAAPVGTTGGTTRAEESEAADAEAGAANKTARTGRRSAKRREDRAPVPDAGTQTPEQDAAAAKPGRPEKAAEAEEPARSDEAGKPEKSGKSAKAPEAETSGPARNAATADDTGAPARTPASQRGDTPASAEDRAHTPVFAAPSPVFLPPAPSESEQAEKPGKDDKSGKRAAEQSSDQDEGADQAGEDTERTDQQAAEDGDGTDSAGRRRRRRGRRGRGRGKGGEDFAAEDQEAGGGTGTSAAEPAQAAESAENANTGPRTAAAREDRSEDQSDQGESAEAGNKRRRRRRRRKGGDGDGAGGAEDPPNTVVHVRESKGEEKQDSKAEDEVRSVRGSTRLEAKRQRRRDGREAGRRRAPILSESEFLARRESVERTMVVAERGDSTQIGVLEDDVLVEHFVTSSSSGSIVGNVYLGRVQNVLPSMEAAFIDIGRGRNAVLYAGEVDWDAAGLEGKARKIEQALSTGDNVLVQVTKDPIGHKGARLTTQVSLPGRFLVYVPSGGTTGISRKLPENERRRLKDMLKRVVPAEAGVIIRTASEGVSEEELGRDVHRLEAQWQTIKERAGSATTSKKSSAPVLLYEEPDLLVKVVRDLFTEDFVKLEIQGSTAWETIRTYLEHVAPDLLDRVKRYVGNGDVFADHRIDEQLTKALDRKVWLPSGGYLVIDRTEAMTVIDVNTGKFTGSGGNLEETVTRNNLESAEEIVRQLRLRDIGGIIVIDFIDMVLESNRELVLRRLTECLGRDRTRHQVAEVTSLGLVQMTRKRVGTGLLEAFSATCEHCKGRGVLVSHEPQKEHGGSGGQGAGSQSGSRKSKNKAKAAETGDAARASEQASPAPTPEQRESAASAVQVMANASKAAKEPEPGEKPDRKPGRKPDRKAYRPAASPAGAEADAAEPAVSNGRVEEKASEKGPEKGTAKDAENGAVKGSRKRAAKGPVKGAATDREKGPDTESGEAGSVGTESAPTGGVPTGAVPTGAVPTGAVGARGAAPATDSAAGTERSAPTSTSPDRNDRSPETPARPDGGAQAEEEPQQPEAPAPRKPARRPRRAASRPAGPPVDGQENS